MEWYELYRSDRQPTFEAAIQFSLRVPMSAKPIENRQKKKEKKK